jgi:hypothetical protein
VPGTLDVLIQFVCDAHVSRDPIGPFVTRHEGAWAYCAGHGATDHRWRRITAIRRELLERAQPIVAPPAPPRDPDVPD